MSAEAKAEVKAIVLALATVNYLDIDKMAAWAKEIPADKLAGLLAAKAPKAQVFAAMREIDDAVSGAMRKAFDADVKAGKEIGPDEMMGFITAMIAMVALSKPEMEKNLLKFLSDYVVGTAFTNATSITNLARPFMLAFEPKLASVAEGRVTSETIAPGQGPVATAFRNMIDTRSGAPEDASPVEKTKAFADKVNVRGAKEMAATLATVASRNLIVDKDGHKQLDFESVNFQFNRDLQGGYKFYFPGVEGASQDYNTNRDRIVRFVTDDNNATFATASEATKRKVGILMALLTQYTSTTSTDIVTMALAQPGSGKGFDIVGDFNAKAVESEFSLSKDADGNIKINTKSISSVLMLMTYGENNAPLSTNQVGKDSYQECEMEITLPKDNLETLANADWTQYNREAVNSYEGDVDGRIALIPPEFRFTGTVNIAYHMHLNEE